MITVVVSLSTGWHEIRARRWRWLRRHSLLVLVSIVEEEEVLLGTLNFVLGTLGYLHIYYHMRTMPPCIIVFDTMTVIQQQRPLHSSWHHQWASCSCYDFGDDAAWSWLYPLFCLAFLIFSIHTFLKQYNYFSTLLSSKMLSLLHTRSQVGTVVWEGGCHSSSSFLPHHPPASTTSSSKSSQTTIHSCPTTLSATSSCIHIWQPYKLDGASSTTQGEKKQQELRKQAAILCVTYPCSRCNRRKFCNWNATGSYPTPVG